MTIKKNQNICFSLVIVMLFVASCQPTKQNQDSQHLKETTHEKSMERMTELYNSGEYSEFIKLAENELKNSDNDFELFLALSDAYGNLGDYDKAFYYANKLLEKEPTNYYAILAIGNYNFILEKLDSAEIYYNEVLRINPNYARANLNLAQLYIKQDNKTKAIEQYLNAIELFKKNNFNDEVIYYSKEVLKLDPNNQSAKDNLSQ